MSQTSHDPVGHCPWEFRAPVFKKLPNCKQSQGSAVLFCDHSSLRALCTDCHNSTFSLPSGSVGMQSWGRRSLERDEFLCFVLIFLEVSVGGGPSQEQGHRQQQSWEMRLGLSPLGDSQEPHHRTYRLQDWVASSQTYREGVQPPHQQTTGLKFY